MGASKQSVSSAKSARGVLWAFCGAFGVIIASHLAAAAILNAYSSIGGPRAAGVISIGVLERHQSLQAVIYFGFLYGVGLILTVGVAYMLRGRFGVVLPFSAPKNGMADYLWATLILVLGGALWLTVLIRYWPDVAMQEVGDYPRLIRTGAGILLVPIFCILAPLAEELLFRGLLLQPLRHTPIGNWGAAVVTSGVWTLLHFDHSLLGHMQFFVAGLLLCWLAIRTGSLRVPIWCHGLYNVLLTVVLVISGVNR